MINEKKLVWARLGDTCDDYMCSIVNKQISKKYLVVQIGKVSPTHVPDATEIALECIANFIKYFTTEEIQKAVKKLREIGYKLPTISLLRISPDIADNVYNVGSSQLGQYRPGSDLHGLFPLKSFPSKIHKNTKGYSNKYYERYRNKIQH